MAEHLDGFDRLAERAPMLAAAAREGRALWCESCRWLAVRTDGPYWLDHPEGMPHLDDPAALPDGAGPARVSVFDGDGRIISDWRLTPDGSWSAAGPV